MKDQIRYYWVACQFPTSLGEAHMDTSISVRGPLSGDKMVEIRDELGRLADRHRDPGAPIRTGNPVILFMMELEEDGSE